MDELQMDDNANARLAEELEKSHNELRRLQKEAEEEKALLKDQVVGVQRALAAEKDKNDTLMINAHTRETIGEGNSSVTSESKLAVTKVIKLMQEFLNEQANPRHDPIRQVWLKNAALTDNVLENLTRVFKACRSIETMDLSNNELTHQSTSEVSEAITSCGSLNFLSIENNRFSYRSLGFFMTAIMERTNREKKKECNAEFMALNMFGNIEGNSLSDISKKVTAQLWEFLHETDHPQVKGYNRDKPEFDKLHPDTIAKMQDALRKIMILNDGEKAITVYDCLDVPVEEIGSNNNRKKTTSANVDNTPEVKQVLPPAAAPPVSKTAQIMAQQEDFAQTEEQAKERAEKVQKKKAMTFNIKQVVTKNNMILMALLDHVLETTSIEAKDNESNMTLLEFACMHGNMGLAKLCYRRGAKLDAVTHKGSTPINIATKKRNYEMMEFLYNYGVKMTSTDANGKTALHVAVSINDLDGICRLVSWGADVSLGDKTQQTPLHVAATHGHEDAAKLLLELGASMNLMDLKKRTPADCAALNDKFALYDRLIALGAVSGMNKWDDYVSSLDASTELLTNKRQIAHLAKKHGPSVHELNRTFKDSN